MNRDVLISFWSFVALAAVVFGAVGAGPVAEPAAEPSSETVAFVGQIPILKAELDAALRDADVKPESASDQARRRALDRLIEDELWLQSALKHGRLQDHRGVREAVTRRMMDVIFPVDEAPSDRDLQPFYDEAYPDGEGPALERVRFRLEERWRRQRNDEALQDYLAWLRRLNRVEISADDAALRAALETGS